MRVLVFDTETTGLPTERNPSITETSKWPYIVQLSYIVYDFESNDIISLYDEILKLPEGIEITAESINLHKITEEINKTAGINRKVSLQQFNNQLETVDLVIGHNISFDKRLIMVECIRNGIQQKFNYRENKKKEYCTMKNNVNLCNIEKIGNNGKKYLKYPTLTELYYNLFNENPKNVHNSLIDVLLTLRCYIKVISNIDLYETNGIFKDMIQ
jgi:DNA polymerase III epsilon subunit-like protein